jgi:hypothetical protein
VELRIDSVWIFDDESTPDGYLELESRRRQSRLNPMRRLVHKPSDTPKRTLPVVRETIRKT